jgi:hypothetical protein
MIIGLKIPGISISPSHMSLSISIFPTSPLLRIKTFTAENAEVAEEKIPNSKHRIPNNRQYPNTQCPRPKNSEIGIWELFGIWHFGFGT